MIFVSHRRDDDLAGRARAAAAYAARQPGYPGTQGVRGIDGAGITVGNWRDDAYEVVVARVEHDDRWTAA